MKRKDLIMITRILLYTILFLKYIMPIIGMKYTFVFFFAITLSWFNIKNVR